MSVKGDKAKRLAAEVLRRVEPFVPPDADVQIVAYGATNFTARRRSNGETVSPILSFGTRVPVPRRLAAKVAALDAVGTVLRICYSDGSTSAKLLSRQFRATGTVTGDYVMASYRRPDDGVRIELDGLPLALFWCRDSR